MTYDNKTILKCVEIVKTISQLNVNPSTDFKSWAYLNSCVIEMEKLSEKEIP
jgi:hypothetical protein